MKIGMKSLSPNRINVQCAHCHSSNVRKSKWVSQLEKNSYPNGAAYRCLDCAKRFIGNQDSSNLKQLKFTLTQLSLAAGLLLLALLGLFFVFEKSASQSIPQSGSALLISAANNSTRMKAAEQGDAQAQFEVGQALLQTIDVNPEETVAAVNWLHKSAGSGNTNAMVLLGRLSKSGIGVLQNYAQSLEWIQAAANKGNSEGMLELGRLYRDGVAVPKDTMQAYIWLNRSAALHNRTAARERDLIAGTLGAEKLKEAQNLSPAVAPQK
jgi:TPR repeat protein